MLSTIFFIMNEQKRRYIYILYFQNTFQPFVFSISTAATIFAFSSIIYDSHRVESNSFRPKRNASSVYIISWSWKPTKLPRERHKIIQLWMIYESGFILHIEWRWERRRTQLTLPAAHITLKYFLSFPFQSEIHWTMSSVRHGADTDVVGCVSLSLLLTHLHHCRIAQG